MVKALHRVSELAGLGVSELNLGVVPARRVVELARYGLAAKAPAVLASVLGGVLSRCPDGRRSVGIIGPRGSDSGRRLARFR